MIFTQFSESFITFEKIGVICIKKSLQLQFLPEAYEKSILFQKKIRKKKNMSGDEHGENDAVNRMNQFQTCPQNVIAATRLFNGSHVYEDEDSSDINNSKENNY